MQRILTYLFTLLLFANLTFPANAQRGFVAVPIDDRGGKYNVTLYKRSFALIIGIDRYENPSWVSLSNAINDARAIAKELSSRNFDVTLKTNLTSSKLKQAIEDFIYEKGRFADARLFIWYAGHGHTINGEGYLVPSDAPSPDKEDWKFRRKALSLREFGRYMREARSKHVLTIFDSCFSGTVFDSARSKPPSSITLATTKNVRQFISSGEAQQAVSDDGLFRKLFLDAIRGEDRRADMNRDGYVIGSELGLYLHQRVTNLTENRQTPRSGKLKAYGYDLGDFVFRTSKPKRSQPNKTRGKPEASQSRDLMKRIARLEAALKARDTQIKSAPSTKKLPTGIQQDLAPKKSIDPDPKKLTANELILLSGDIEKILAKNIWKLTPNMKARLQNLFLFSKAFKGGNYKTAEKHLNSIKSSELDKMTANLARAWVFQAQQKTRKSLKQIARLNKLKWAKVYQDVNKAMIADLAGRKSTARKSYQQTVKKDPNYMRWTEAYVRHLSHSGAAKKALKEISRYSNLNGPHPILTSLKNKIEQKEKLALMASTPQQGLAELYFAISDNLGNDEATNLRKIYLQLALYLRPDHTLATISLAKIYERGKQHVVANRLIKKVDNNSPMHAAVTVERAFILNSLKRVNAAKNLLDGLIAREPTDIVAFEAQGNILRANKRYVEAIGYYSSAIKLLTKPQKYDWKYYYSRGVCYERLGEMEKSEADLEKAIALDPDQSLPLNYLGYTLLDQDKDLARATKLIRKAVKLKPDDGYFIDSLGLAIYKKGNYVDAAKKFERANKLHPDDSVINDHLGDAYFKLNRKNDAQKAWKRALKNNPEPKQATLIRKKLENQ